jgi:DNA-binding response OmpR family regulator
MNKILIVEDDYKLSLELQKFLSNNSFKAMILKDFSSPIAEIMNNPVDLILLDINLPVMSGEAIIKELKPKLSTPVIIITSQNTDIDELLCLNYGADDFITKPFNLQVLLARINRLLKKNNNSLLTFADLKIDLSNSTISNNTKKLVLTRNELKILTYLVNHLNEIVARDALMDYLWNNDAFVDDNTLTVNIKRLRDKLAKFNKAEHLETRRGQGYILS